MSFAFISKARTRSCKAEQVISSHPAAKSRDKVKNRDEYRLSILCDTINLRQLYLSITSTRNSLQIINNSICFDVDVYMHITSLPPPPYLLPSRIIFAVYVTWLQTEIGWPKMTRNSRHRNMRVLNVQVNFLPLLLAPKIYLQKYEKDVNR